MLHSSIVGGSTAKRVINCPASVALCAKMPPKPSSAYADRGTLLHDAISQILDTNADVIGMKYNDHILTQELYDEKIVPALAFLDEINVDGSLEYAVESRVGFGDLLPGVFGSADLLGRIGDRAIVLDWKFGDGVVVDAVENEQLMFYARRNAHRCVEVGLRGRNRDRVRDRATAYDPPLDNNARTHRSVRAPARQSRQSSRAARRWSQGWRALPLVCGQARLPSDDRRG